MGVAAYNRGSHAIRQSISRDERPPEFLMMDRLNELDKYQDAGVAPGELVFTHSRGVWWVNVADRSDGFGYWYRSLHEAVKRWKVEIYGYRNGAWFARPKS